MKKFSLLAIFLVILLSGVHSLFAQEDMTPPVLQSLEFTPKIIDVSGGPQSITVTVRITDNLSGFGGAWLSFSSPSGQQGGTICNWVPISGNAQDGVYQDQLVIPQFSEGGTWRAAWIGMRDAVGNQTSLYEADLIAAGFSTELEVQGGPDMAAPQLLEFSLSPSSIDVSGAAGTVVITMRVADNLSGFGGAWLSFSSPSGQQGGTICNWVPISGNAQDGVYQDQLVIPQFSEGGKWRAAWIGMRDAVGNQTSLYEADLIAAGFSTKLAVVSDPVDSSPPSLVEFSLSPSSIDVSGAAGTVVVTMRVADDLSGFGGACWLSFSSPSGQQGGTICNWVRISGNAQDGVYQDQIVIPQFSEGGTWRAAWIGMRDAIGNQTSFYEADLIEAGFSTTIQVSINVPPVANAGSDRTVLVQEAVPFDGSKSSDPDGSITHWNWDFGDNSPTAIGILASHAYAQPGQYTVTLTVTDNDGGTAVDQSLVVVKAPITAVGDLIANVNSSITGNQQNSLLSKLNSVLDSLKKKNDGAAINKLMSFIEEVNAQKGKKIPGDVADRWIALANRIIAAVQAGANTLKVSTIDALTRAQRSNLLESSGHTVMEAPALAIRPY